MKGRALGDGAFDLLDGAMAAPLHHVNSWERFSLKCQDDKFRYAVR